jgi:LmbE family N-acetylglucosaminyl deacetylase
MKRAGWVLVGLVLLASCRETVTVEDLRRFAATERFPEDVYLDTVSVRRAMVIVAHDDDDCAMAGTIAKLTREGWDIRQLSLQNHIVARTGDNPVKMICRGNELLLSDGFYRIGLDTMKYPYLPIPYEAIKEQFLTEKVAERIVEKVEAFGPSVLFTLDNVKGGYGHPEHIFISQLVVDLFESGRIGPEKIYQSVYTDHMEVEIVDKWLGARMKKWGYPDASAMANEMYGISGMPEPTVEVDIEAVAQAKMDYLRAYDEDVRSALRKFIPYYEEFDANTYFSVFNKEYFRVIERPSAAVE